MIVIDKGGLPFTKLISQFPISQWTTYAQGFKKEKD